MNSKSCRKFDDCNSEPLMEIAHAKPATWSIVWTAADNEYVRWMMEKPASEPLSKPDAWAVLQLRPSPTSAVSAA